MVAHCCASANRQGSACTGCDSRAGCSTQRCGAHADRCTCGRRHLRPQASFFERLPASKACCCRCHAGTQPGPCTGVALAARQKLRCCGCQNVRWSHLSLLHDGLLLFGLAPAGLLHGRWRASTDCCGRTCSASSGSTPCVWDSSPARGGSQLLQASLRRSGAPDIAGAAPAPAASAVPIPVPAPRATTDVAAPEPADTCSRTTRTEGSGVRLTCRNCSMSAAYPCDPNPSERS